MILAAFARRHGVNPKASETVELDDLLQEELNRIRNLDPSKPCGSENEIVVAPRTPGRILA